MREHDDLDFWLEKFGIGRTTLHNILKEKEQILSLASSGYDIHSKSRSMAKMAKNDLEIFRFFGVFGRVFGRAPAPKTPSAARTAWKRLLYRRS